MRVCALSLMYEKSLNEEKEKERCLKSTTFNLKFAQNYLP